MRCVCLAGHSTLNRFQSALVASLLLLVFLSLQDQLMTEKGPCCIQTLPVLLHQMLRGRFLIVVVKRSRDERLERLGWVG